MQAVQTIQDKNIFIPEIKFALHIQKKPAFAEYKTLKSSQDTAETLRQLFNPDTINLQESFYFLCLNQANKITGFCQLSTGGITSTVADPKLILATALQKAACSIILAHNHPSGNTNPSEADKTMTLKIKQAAQLLDIRLLDHIILTEENYFSFADEGLI